MRGGFGKERVVEVGRLLADLRRSLRDRLGGFVVILLRQFLILLVVLLVFVVVRSLVSFEFVIVLIFWLDRLALSFDVLGSRRLGLGLLSGFSGSAVEVMRYQL